MGRKKKGAHYLKEGVSAWGGRSLIRRCRDSFIDTGEPRWRKKARRTSLYEGPFKRGKETYGVEESGKRENRRNDGKNSVSGLRGKNWHEEVIHKTKMKGGWSVSEKKKNPDRLRKWDLHHRREGSLGKGGAFF